MEAIFQRLLGLIQSQQKTIKELADKIEKLESIGGGGTASIEDYVSGTNYERNTLIVDTNTETVYRVLQQYKSINVDEDISNGYLKLVGFESQIVTYDHNPTQEEIDAIPEDALVAVYSATDTPYMPDQQS